MKTRFALLMIFALAACTPTVAPPVPGASSSPDISLIGSLPSASPSAVSGDVVPAGAFLFYEDFEQSTDRWTLPDSPAPGWRLLQAFTCGGAYTMHVGLPEQAPFTPQAGESTFVTARAIDLTKGKTPKLKFDLLGTATPASALTIHPEVREPGGAWTALGAPLTAQYVTMRSIVRDLTPYAGKKIELRFRAVMEAGQAETKGLFLDDIQVIEPA